MSKRTKATVDYFPHIIKKGKTIFILESKFGNDGYAFWFKLLELLGDNEGHYIDCNDPSTWEYLLAYIRVDEETVNKIIGVLIELGNIDKELWEHKIIFCQNFIDNIGDVYKRRIIEKPTKEAICQQLGIVLTVKCIQLPTSNGINVNIYPQSKVKESKEDIKEVQNTNFKNLINNSKEKAKEEPRKANHIEFDFELWSWHGIDEDIKDRWAKIFLHVEVEIELMKMRDYFKKHPKHEKVIEEKFNNNYAIYIFDWLTRAEKWKIEELEKTGM